MSPPTLERVRDFLFHEAGLLDAWRLREWADLFADDGVYLVPPPTDPEGDPARTLFLVYDDRARLTERATRLLKRTAHAEFPHSVTTRLVSNVRMSMGDDGELCVDSVFIVHRARGAKLDVFPGRSRHLITTSPEGDMRIRSKRAMLGLDTLRPQDKLTIIL
jgi:p-cumate 2,3-dioxygenase beta subunit